MLDYLDDFLSDETGAITVDWVVLTAAIIGLGLAVILSVGDGTMTYAERLGLFLTLQDVTTTY